MSDINTTSINDLPTDPMGSNANNISIIASEKGSANMNTNASTNANANTNSLSLDQSTISQIVNGLQQASVAGATMLPSRDIPQSTQALTQDAFVKPNYVPPPSNTDYINDNLEPSEYINSYQQEAQIKNSLDSVYDEIQTPLLISILYFLFQLPIMKKTLFKYIPYLCHSDGNYNLNGLVFSSAAFGFLFYSLSKTMRQFNTF
jgi:hypothetical protein